MSQSSTILIVDDDSAIVDLLAEVLTDEGYQVRQATTSADALAALLTAPPDLAFIDLRLSGMGGLAVIQAARTHGSDVPIILMTAATLAGQNLDMQGVTALLPKPFDLDDVLACAADHLWVGTPTT